MNPTPSPTPDVSRSAGHALVLAAMTCAVDQFLSANGTVLTLDSAARVGPGRVPVEATGCVLGALGIPESVIARMEGTTAADGEQKDAWNGIEATWTYSPTEGLDVVLTDTGESTSPSRVSA